MRFACLCCGSLTLDNEPPGTYDICPVCYWEDDPVQGVDVDAQGGANSISLREARCNFACFGAVEKRFEELVRGPSADEVPSNNGEAEDGGCRSEG